MVNPPVFQNSAQSAWNSSTTPKATSAFITSAAAGHVLVTGIIDADDNGTENYAFSNTGGAQTWTENPETAGSTGNDNWMQTATAIVDAGGVSSGTVSVSRTAGGGDFWGHCALWFSGSDGIGTVERRATTGTTCSFNITTQFDNSALVVYLGDWAATDASTRTWKTINGYAPSVANGGEKAYFRDASAYTVAVAVYPDIGTAGPQTIGLDNPPGTTMTGDWMFAVVEVRGAPDPYVPVDGEWLLEDGTGSWLLEDDSGVWVGEQNSGIAATDCSPTAIASAEAHGSPVVSTVVTASATAIASAEAHGSPTLTNVLTAVELPGISTAEAHGTTAVSTTLTCSPTAISSGEAFGTPSAISQIAASPTGISSGEVVGTPSVSTQVTTSPTAISSSEAFGTPSVSGQVTASPTGISSGQVVGTPSASTQLATSPTAITSVEAFGTPSLSSQVTTSPTAIASAETFGTPFASSTYLAIVDAIASFEAFGTALVNAVTNVAPLAIPGFGTGFGVPAAVPATLEPGSFGTPTVTMGVGSITAVPSGILSAVAFGTPSVTGVLIVSPIGIGSVVSFGNVVIQTLITVSPVGIISIAAVGTPRVNESTEFIGWGIPMGINL